MVNIRPGFVFFFTMCTCCGGVGDISTSEPTAAPQNVATWAIFNLIFWETAIWTPPSIDQLAGESRAGSVVWEDTFLHRDPSAKTLAVLAERAVALLNYRCIGK